MVRPKRLVDMLARSGFELHLAVDPLWRTCLGEIAATVHENSARSPERLQADLRWMRPIFGPNRLARYLAEDLALIERVRPDLVVFDFRPTVPIAAALRGVRSVSILNAYHSPFARQVIAMPDTIGVRAVGLCAAKAIYRTLPRPFERMVLGPLVELRRRHGLAGGSTRAFDVLSGDTVLHPDADHFAPTPGAPAEHLRIGPLPWHPPRAAPLPPRAGGTRSRPLAYVTFGSSGDVRLLPTVCEALVAAGADVLCATAGRLVPPALSTMDRVRVAAFVDGGEACRRADIVVSNGGNPQLVQALAAGTPVLGLPSNYDQALNSAHAGWTGAARSIHPARASKERVRRFASEMMGASACKEAAVREAGRIAAIDVEERVCGAFAALV